MKYRFSQFKDFLRTPFPYLILALTIFMASTLLSNQGFVNALKGNSIGQQAGDQYSLCLVCSGPGAKDALSDIGFTAANFVLFPVTLVVFGAMGLLGKIAIAGPATTYTVYLSLTILYGLLMPFFIFVCYEAFADRLPSRAGIPSVYRG